MLHKIAQLLLVGAGLVTTLQAAPAQNHVYILTGQSNSLGAVKGSPATQEQLERYKSPAKLWNGNMVRDSGEKFDKSPAWQDVQPQLPEYNGNRCMGPEYGFAHMMHRLKLHSGGNRQLSIIKASLDGGGNSFWMPDKTAWISLSSTVQEALAALPGETKVYGLLYLQGESDKGNEISLAPERFLDLHARLKQKVGKKGLPIAVVGECATWHGREGKDAQGNTSAALMQDMATKKKNIGWVHTRDLTKITSGDNMGVHYDGKSQITIGARFAYAVARLEKKALAPARSDNPTATLEQPAAWWSGKRPGAKDVITWDVAAANCADTLGVGLAVSGLAVEDPFRGKVTISPAKKAGATLSIGAKGIKLTEGDLELLCTTETTADQEWSIAPGYKLSLGTPSAPVTLKGSGCISLVVPEGAELELHLASPPTQSWNLAHPLPRQQKLSIGGKAADFRKEGEGVYKLEILSAN